MPAESTGFIGLSRNAIFFKFCKIQHLRKRHWELPNDTQSNSGDFLLELCRSKAIVSGLSLNPSRPRQYHKSQFNNKFAFKEYDRNVISQRHAVTQKAPSRISR